MRELIVSLARRWYLVVAALLLTAGACFAASTAVPAQYETKASMVLVPPKSAEFPEGNRFLMLEQLGQATGVVIRALNADETHRAVAPASESGAEFLVEPDYTTNAPILVITATSPTAAGASELIAAVEGQVPSILTRLQDDVSIAEGARIAAVPVTTADSPVQDPKNQLRAVVATGIGIAVLLVLLIGAVDGYLLRRSRPLEVDDDAPDGRTESSGSDGPVDIGRAERRTRRRESAAEPFDRAGLG